MPLSCPLEFPARFLPVSCSEFSSSRQWACERNSLLPTLNLRIISYWLPNYILVTLPCNFFRYWVRSKILNISWLQFLSLAWLSTHLPQVFCSTSGIPYEWPKAKSSEWTFECRWGVWWPLEGMLCTLLLEHLPKESNGGSLCGNFQMRILHKRLLFFHTEARS